MCLNGYFSLCNPCYDKCNANRFVYIQARSKSAIYSLLAWAPYLHFFPVNVYCFHGEIDPDGISVSFNEITSFEALDHTGFSRSTVANENHFEQKIKWIVCWDSHKRCWISGCHHGTLLFLFTFSILHIYCFLTISLVGRCFAN